MLLECSSVQPYCLGALARCRGLIASESDFPQSFLSSLELLEPLGLPFPVARSRVCYGERLRRAGQRVDARGQLTPGLDIFERLGARCWAERAETELRATGQRLRRREPTDREELTPQELQIALSVADGKTNKEVAAALFLSPKTIEAHLGRIYRKLGITSRGQLIRALSRDEARTGS